MYWYIYISNAEFCSFDESIIKSLKQNTERKSVEQQILCMRDRIFLKIGDIAFLIMSVIVCNMGM